MEISYHYISKNLVKYKDIKILQISNTVSSMILIKNRLSELPGVEVFLYMW